MAKRLIRPKEAMRRIGVGHSKFYESIVGHGLLEPVRLGARSIAFDEDKLDELIEDILATGDLRDVIAKRTARHQPEGAA